MDKQTAKLLARIAENLPDMDGGLMQDWIDNPKGLQNVLKLALCPPEATSAPREEVLPDSTIRIDRTIRPTYPEWFKELVHPELESAGPPEFDAAKLGHWLHPDQVNGTVGGKKLLKYLEDKKMLESCLGLRDLEEIQRKGVAFFRKYFQGKTVFGWRSVVRNHHGYLIVPYLVESGDKVVVHWHWFDNDLDAYNPALRFATHFISLLLLWGSFVLQSVRASRQDFAQSLPIFPTAEYIS